jgi:AmiR/NasT family two-component response regulator
MDSRAELFQARGMIMVQLDMSISNALARMRAHAYAENRPLAAVARDVVARRLRFDRTTYDQHRTTPRKAVRQS